jgi:hypothetical protein
VKIASEAEVASDFPLYLKASEEGPIVVTRDGEPVAVLLRTEGHDDLERLLMGHSPKLQKILQAARMRFRAGAGISHETFWKEIEAGNSGEPKKRSRVPKGNRTDKSAR